MEGRARRGALFEAFIAGFIDGVTWKAMLVVADGAFPGKGLGALLSRRIDGLRKASGVPDGEGDAALAFPIWADESGLAVDLSTRFSDRRDRVLGPGGAPAEPVRPRFVQRHSGVLVIDTLNPQSLYRPVAGPAEPGGYPDRRSVQPGEDDRDTEVVIVADLRAAGARVVDANVLWSYARQVVSTTLHGPARRMLRVLREVVFVDPGLGIVACVHVDVEGRPWWLLAFAPEEDAVRFFRP